MILKDLKVKKKSLGDFFQASPLVGLEQ